MTVTFEVVVPEETPRRGRRLDSDRALPMNERPLSEKPCTGVDGNDTRGADGECLIAGRKIRDLRLLGEQVCSVC